MLRMSAGNSGGIGRILAPLVLGAALIASGAWAQDAMVRLRGTIERVEGGVYIVKSREAPR